MGNTEGFAENRSDNTERFRAVVGFGKGTEARVLLKKRNEYGLEWLNTVHIAKNLRTRVTKTVCVDKKSNPWSRNYGSTEWNGKTRPVSRKVCAHGSWSTRRVDEV